MAKSGHTKGRGSQRSPIGFIHFVEFPDGCQAMSGVARGVLLNQAKNLQYQHHLQHDLSQPL
jgi:hypothetical protein